MEFVPQEEDQCLCPLCSIVLGAVINASDFVFHLHYLAPILVDMALDKVMSR
jgi:hypothetical protein